MEEKHTSHETSHKHESKNKKSPLVWVLLGVLSTLVVVCLIGMAVVVSQARNVSYNPTIVKASQFLRVAAAEVNGEKILYSDYIQDMETLKKFYAAQGAEFPPVAEKDISDMTISRLVANKLIAQIAKDNNVEVTQADVDAKKQELLEQFTNEAEVNAELQKNYGWNFDTYVEKVIRPLILEQKLQDAFNSSTDPMFANFQKEEVRARHILFSNSDKTDDEAKKQAEDVLARLKKGEDFEALAKQFGSDGTKELGGDLGWFSRDQMVKEFADAAFALEKGQLSELVKTEFGYHVIRVDDTRQIKDFITFMDNQIAKADIVIFININNPFATVKEQLMGVNTDVSAPAVQ